MITKRTCEDFRNDFTTAVKALEQKYGLTISLGTIKFNEVVIKAKIEASSIAPIVLNNTLSTPQIIQSRIAQERLPITLHEKGFIGSTYTLPNKRPAYTVTGVNMRAPKFCVEVITENGAQYRMPLEALSRATLIGHK